MWRLDPRAKVKNLCKLAHSVFKDLSSQIEYIQNGSIEIISNELSHLHTSIIKIHMKKERAKEYKNYFKENELDLRRTEEEKNIEEMLDKMEDSLIKEGKEFVYNV